MKEKIILLLSGYACSFIGYSQQPASFPTPIFKKDTINIALLGAKPDGVTLNTATINSAIANCAKKGGGTMLIPAGFWLTGPIVLQSNVNLHLANGALLQFTNDFNQYPLVAGNWEGVTAVRNQSPISANNATNIAITGNGIIDGWGDAWRAVKKDKLTESQWKKLLASGGVVNTEGKTWYPSEKALKGNSVKDAGQLKDGKTMQDFADIKDFLRPNLLVLTQCKNVLLEGVTFQNSPAWCLHPLLCTNLTIRNVTVKNPWYAQNGDGLDIESCKNVWLSNSSFDVGDDGICIKSGRDEQGRKRGVATESVVVTNCVVYHAHGGFVIGSEMSGGAKNIWVSHCTFIGTDIGLRFKTTRGRGGVVENIYVDGVAMKDIGAEAILFDMHYMTKDPILQAGETVATITATVYPVTEATPQFKNFYIQNIVCNGADKGIFIRGLPEMNVQNINLQNLVLQTKKGILLEEASHISIKNAQLITQETNPVVLINNSNNIAIRQLAYNPKTTLLTHIKGSRSNNIVFSGTNYTNCSKKAVFENGALETALKLE